MDVHYLVASQEELKNYQDFYQKHQSQLADFEVFLRTHYALEELPQMLVFSNLVGATSIVRDITIPAYANDTRLVITPEIDSWKQIYLAQLDDYPNEDTSAIKVHYSRLSENHLLQIIGHELAHWSELFEDDFDDYHSFIWFEEGMVEYLSRQYFLTADEFQAEKIVIRHWLICIRKNMVGIHLMILGKKLMRGIMPVFFMSTGEVF